MNITGYEFEKLIDPTGILEGDRYEFFIDIEVDEEDEMYSENGLYIRLILAILGEKTWITQYHIYEKTTDKYLDFALEGVEEEELLQFVKEIVKKENAEFE